METDLNERLRWIRELSCNSKRKDNMIRDLLASHYSAVHSELPNKELMEDYKLHRRKDEGDKPEDRNPKDPIMHDYSR